MTERKRAKSKGDPRSIEAGENPWLLVPAASYDAHMSDPEVEQAAMLADELAAALDRTRPKSCAVLGAATGNGFDRLAGRGLTRIVAVDINPEYLAILAARHRALPGLETACGDVADPQLFAGAVELISAALIFEYVDPPTLLANIARWLTPGGVMAVLLQEPVETAKKISASAVKADLAPIADLMRLVPPDEFRAMAGDAGFRETTPGRTVVAHGKRFFVGNFVRA